MSFRCVRSPEAPKIVSTQGSAARRLRSPSRSGFCSVTAGACVISLRLHGVTAELLAKGRVDLRAEGLVLAGGEASEEGGRDDGSGDAFVDGFEDRPAAFARVLHVAGDPLEVVAVLLESVVQELQQPAADDGSVPPDPCDLLQVELEL